MKATKKSFFAVISFILLASIACSLVSSFPSLPTQAPAEEAEPTEEASVPDEQTDESEPGPEPTESDAMVPPPEGDACANVLYPLIPGYQWVYEVSWEDETTQIGVSVSEVNQNEAKVNALYMGSGATTEATISCQDGAIVSFPTILLGFLFGGAEGNIDIQHQDGVFMPAYATLEGHNWDYQWVSEYTASGVIQAEIDGDQVTGRLDDSPLSISWNTMEKEEDVFAFDPITVQAGQYPEAIKLRHETQLDFSAELEEGGVTTSLSATLTTKSSSWFQPNLGLLKQEIKQASAKIYGISFPITMDTTIELVEFRIEE
jgi:hypothetical protein